MNLLLRSGRRGVLTLLLLVLSEVFLARGSSQAVRETQLHQLDQVYGSDKALVRFFRNLNIPLKSDTVYVFVVPPMNAARIEGAISRCANLLRRTGVKADIIALAVCNKRRAAERYLQRRAFACDYNLVTDEKFLNCFAFSSGDLRVPFITKFNVGTGELLSSYSLLGTTDSATVAWFVSDQSKPRARRPAGGRLRLPRMKTAAYRPVVDKQLKLKDSDEYPLSTGDYASVNPSGTLFSLGDNLTNCIYVFDLTTGRLFSVLFPDSSEQTRFIDCPVPVYQLLKQNNVVNSMYFSHAFSDDTSMVVAASLPRVAPEVKGKDTTIGYRNAPVLIKKNVLNNDLIGCASLQSLPDTVRGHFSHKDASLVCGSNLAFVPFRKGWPYGNQSLDEDVPPEDNPFTDEFYRQNVFQFAAYNLDGRFKGLWGKLGERFEKLRLGYIAGGGLVRFRGCKFYLSDQCSGKICILNQDASLCGSITIFEDPPLVFPAIDRTKEPERYLLETFKRNFKARIVDLLVTDDYLYALVVWDESQPIVYKVGLKDQGIRKFGLPTRYGNKDAKHYLLRQTSSGICTVSLLESGNETWYCEFRIP